MATTSGFKWKWFICDRKRPENPGWVVALSPSAFPSKEEAIVDGRKTLETLGVEVVDSFISEAKREFGSHFVENKRLRTTGGIFLRKLKQTPHKRFIFKGQKPESI